MQGVENTSQQEGHSEVFIKELEHSYGGTINNEGVENTMEDASR